MRSFELLFLFPLTALAQSSSPKRGLCYVPSTKYPSDDQIWFTNVAAPPTWYYNYGPNPTSAYTSRRDLQFVPMLWGASPTDTGTPFSDNIKAQIASGTNITYILSFNEPDATHAVGGSQLDVNTASSRWKAELAPLQKLGIKIGAPAVTGGASGWTWLDNWFKACAGECNPDFMTVHWYGNLEGMMSHIGQVAAKYPDKGIWVTEYGYADQALGVTQQFFNASLASFDGWKNVTHYSYFGAFRSDVSNVGKNAAMLNQNGQLTDIGSWYLGGKATGVVPQGAGARHDVFSLWSIIFIALVMTFSIV